MTFEDHLRVIDEYRKYSDHIPGNVHYKHKQMYNGKQLRTRVACLMLYPIYDDSHYNALKILNDQGWSYVCAMHDHDKYDSNSGSELDIFSEDSAEGVVSASPSDIPEDDVNFDPENIKDGSTGLKKIHEHGVMYFENARTNTAVAKLLGINSVYVKMFRDKELNKRIGYLTHMDDLDKFQYSPNILYGPLRVRYAQINTEHLKRPSDLLQDILLEIKNSDMNKYIRSTDYFLKLIRNGYDSILTKYRPIIRDAIIEHNFYCNFLRQEGIREVGLDKADYNPDSYCGRLEYNNKSN